MQSNLIDQREARLLEATVPATPAWTGRQLLAHVVGIPSDVLAGRLDGVGTDAWSARQVAERSDRSVAELVEEWRASAPAFDERVKNAPEGMAGALAADILEHELDLRGLLAVPVPEACVSAVEPCLNFMLGFLDRRVKQAGLDSLRLRAGNQEWTVGPGDSPVAASVVTTPVELFRVVAGRRSPAQVASLDWEGDPAPYFPVLSAFGPLADSDVHEHLA